MDHTIFDKRDPIERYLDNSRKSLAGTKRGVPEAFTTYEEAIDQTLDEKKRVDTSRLILDEYLIRYTSEDNQSYSELNQRDRESFRQRIAWMFNETEKHNKLNQLAIEQGSKERQGAQRMLL